MASRWRRARWRRSATRVTTRVLLPTGIVAVVVALLVGGVADIGRASGSYRQTVNRGYGALVSTAALASNQSAATLRSLLAGAADAQRVALFTGLDEVAGAAIREQRSAAASTPPEPAAAASSCRAAFADRAGGVGALRDALESAVGGRAGTGPLAGAAGVAAVAAAFGELSTADAAWATCRHDLRLAAGGARLPASAWMSGATAAAAADPGRLVGELLRAPGLAVRHAVFLAVLSTAPPVLPSAGPGQLPPTSSVMLHILVGDRGNVDEPALQVQAALQPLGGGAQPAPLTAIVSLRAGGTTAVVLGPYAVRPGAAYNVVVTAVLPAGSGAQVSVPLQVAELPPTTTTTTTTTLPPKRTTTTTGARGRG